MGISAGIAAIGDVIGGALGIGAAEAGGAAALGGAAAGGGLLSGVGGLALAGAGGLALGSLFKGPQVPNPGVDPSLGAASASATQTLQQQLQVEAQGDTASIMARYGTRLALSGAVPGAASLGTVTGAAH